MSTHYIIQDSDPLCEAANDHLSVLGTIFSRYLQKLQGNQRNAEFLGKITHINLKYHIQTANSVS